MCRRPLPHQGDAHQFGDDFVIDPAGNLVFAYRSATPADRPPIDAVVEAVRGATANE